MTKESERKALVHKAINILNNYGGKQGEIEAAINYLCLALDPDNLYKAGKFILDVAVSELNRARFNLLNIPEYANHIKRYLNGETYADGKREEYDKIQLENVEKILELCKGYDEKES